MSGCVSVFTSQHQFLVLAVVIMSIVSPYKNIDVLEYLDKELKQVGCSLQCLVSWLMKTPSITTFRVNMLQHSVNEVKKLFEDGFKEQERSYNKTQLPQIKEVSELPGVLIIQSWQVEEEELSCMDGEPQVCEIIVDAMVGAAILRGAHVYAPGVLAMPKGTCRGQKVNIYADVEGKCLQGMTAKYEGRKQYVGVGEVKMERNELFVTAEPPKGIAILVTSTPSGCPSLSPLPSMGMLQNLPSILASLELDPKPGQTILDMCAAPGNKTTHIAALMDNQGILVALDRTAKKAQQIKDLCQVLSAKCQIYSWDSTKAVAAENARDVLLGPPFSPGTFDKVLLDAPCSALGQRPQLLNKCTLSQLKSYPALQQKLFKAAYALTRPGGEIVYSTCTVTCSENEGLVVWALKLFGTGLTLLPPRMRMTPVIPAYSDVSDEISSCVQRFGPPVPGKENQYIDSVGFFIARFRKNE